MSICCAFSFSLILLFCFGFFPWAGVGEACAGVVNISIYIYILFLFFLEGLLQSCLVSPLPAVPFCPGPPPGLCVYPLLATDAAPCSSWSSGSGCFAFFLVYFWPQIFTCPNPALCSHSCTQDTCSDPRGGVCVCVCAVCVCSVCVCVSEVCFGSRGRTRRGVLHRFSKDFLRDFVCGSPLPPLSSVKWTLSCCFNFHFIITSRNSEKES